MVKIIMKDDSIKELDGYEDIPRYIGHDLIFYEEYGSYQGDWIMVSKKDDIIYLWRGGYGSCSGCDHFQDWEYGGKYYSTDNRPQEEGDKFAYAYSPEEQYNINDISVDIITNYIKKQELEDDDYKELTNAKCKAIAKRIKESIEKSKEISI